MKYSKNEMQSIAKELGFVRDTLEKVMRLTDILRFFEQSSVLSNAVALKGGTAINLSVFDLPRLSVDIDLDLARSCTPSEMKESKEQITPLIKKYMDSMGYALSSKSKNYYALDSFVYSYQNCGGTKDNLKIEINYMLRSHILAPEKRSVELPWTDSKLSVLSLNPIEIFASKIVALVNRGAARDLYDIHNLIKYRLFDEKECDMLRKCVVFYGAVGSQKPPCGELSYKKLDEITNRRITTDLYPVLRKGENFDLSTVKSEVVSYLSDILTPTRSELQFWENFRKGIYSPELVFDNREILNSLYHHPMAEWKCKNQMKEKEAPQQFRFTTAELKRNSKIVKEKNSKKSPNKAKQKNTPTIDD